MKNLALILLLAYAVGVSLRLRDLQYFFTEEAKSGVALCNTNQKWASKTYGWVECSAWRTEAEHGLVGRGSPGVDGPPGPKP